MLFEFVIYVISSTSIEEAIYRLENDVWPTGINAIVFLLYKPVGLGNIRRAIRKGEKLNRFMKAALERKHSYRIGFDTCFTPILIDYRESFDMHSIDSCEAARFSMYIDSEMNAYPCSFDNQQGRYRVTLKDSCIQSVWNSPTFDSFRQRKNNCLNCSAYKLCNGGCGLELGIDIGSNCI